MLTNVNSNLPQELFSCLRQSRLELFRAASVWALSSARSVLGSLARSPRCVEPIMSLWGGVMRKQQQFERFSERCWWLRRTCKKQDETFQLSTIECRDPPVGIFSQHSHEFPMCFSMWVHLSAPLITCKPWIYASNLHSLAQMTGYLRLLVK